MWCDAPRRNSRSRSVVPHIVSAATIGTVPVGRCPTTGRRQFMPRIPAALAAVALVAISIGFNAVRYPLVSGSVPGRSSATQSGEDQTATNAERPAGEKESSVPAISASVSGGPKPAWANPTETASSGAEHPSGPKDWASSGTKADQETGAAVPPKSSVEAETAASDSQAPQSVGDARRRRHAREVQLRPRRGRHRSPSARLTGPVLPKPKRFQPAPHPRTTDWGRMPAQKRPQTVILPLSTPASQLIRMLMWGRRRFQRGNTDLAGKPGKETPRPAGPAKRIPDSRHPRKPKASFRRQRRLRQERRPSPRMRHPTPGIPMPNQRAGENNFATCRPWKTTSLQRRRTDPSRRSFRSTRRRGFNRRV